MQRKTHKEIEVFWSRQSYTFRKHPLFASCVLYYLRALDNLLCNSDDLHEWVDIGNLKDLNFFLFSEAFFLILGFLSLSAWPISQLIVPDKNRLENYAQVARKKHVIIFTINQRFSEK